MTPFTWKIETTDLWIAVQDYGIAFFIERKLQWPKSKEAKAPVEFPKFEIRSEIRLKSSGTKLERLCRR